MTVTRIDAKSVLAIEIGSTLTRALLFDAVEGGYRFLAEGNGPTTAGAPVKDVSEGVRLALDHLEKISGRRLVDENERLITPVSADGSGVDSFVAMYSAGPPIRVLAVGLLDEISLESARHLVSTTYARLVGQLALNDRRKIEEQIDLIIRVRPDLILVAGGTEDGATQSILNLIEPVGLACYLMNTGGKPEILYSGNQVLAEEVEARLGSLTSLHLAPNIRPGLEDEQLGPAQFKLMEVYRDILSNKVPGVEELNTWAGGRLVPSATAFGRVIRFLSKVYDPSKGVLGVNVGISASTVAAAFDGDLRLTVIPELGMGQGLASSFAFDELPEITKWLPMAVPDTQVYDYLHNRSLHPTSLAVSQEELALDQALTRAVLRRTIQRARRGFPAAVLGRNPYLLPPLEPIVATGPILTRAPKEIQNALMLLDGLQPVGVTTLVLDQNNLAPALGAASAVNQILAVQVLETGTFLNLGTVVSPVGQARPGSPVLQARLTYEDGSEVKHEIVKGSLETLPLANGQAARLHLQPLQRHDVGMGGPGRGGSLRVLGGSMGVIIDARGRPLQLPSDDGTRHELLQGWALGLEK